MIHSGVCSITKKSLNALTGHRLISIQGAAYNIEKLDFVKFYDSIHDVGLKKHLDDAQMKKGWNKKCLVSSYRIRDEKLDWKWYQNRNTKIQSPASKWND